MRLESNGHQQSHRLSMNGSSLSSPTQPHGSASSHKRVENGETNGYHTNGHHVSQQSPFYGHDREEVTRILLQSLADLGYHGAAQQLSNESGYEVESASVVAFRVAVQNGEWEEAEALLFGDEHAVGEAVGEMDEQEGVMLGNGHSHAHSPSRRKSQLGRHRHNRSANGLSSGSISRLGGAGLPLAQGADTTTLKFLLRQQKYLELLEERELNLALAVLRNELTPLKKDIGRLHALSSLMMCPSAQDLRAQAGWDGASGSSRNLLLSEISRSISPSVMIPEHRLATLFSAVQQEQVLSCRFHNTMVPPSLYTDHDCSADDFPLHTLLELKHHSDEVWYVTFSHDGSMLATAGKDGLVCVYDTQRWKIRHEFREHERHPPSASTTATSSPRSSSSSENHGVCFIAFSPDDKYLISCAQNNEFVVVDVRSGRRVAHADHFDYPVTTAAWLPDSQTFVVGTQGSKRPLGLYALRSSSGTTSTSPVIRNNEIHSWRNPTWDPQAKDQAASFRITACAISPDGSRLVATTVANSVHLYDLPSRKKIDEWQMEDKLTSVHFSSDGAEVLLSMNQGRVLLLDAETGEVRRRFEGAVQREFVVRSCFGGAGGGVVASGSEDSKVLLWRRQTGRLIATLDAHAPACVNAVAWHPSEPGIFASAGDDRRVRIWASANAIAALGAVPS